VRSAPVGDGSRVDDELALRAGSSAEALGRGWRDLHGGEGAGVRGFGCGGGVVLLWALLHRPVAAPQADLNARILALFLPRAATRGTGAPETMTLRRGRAQARRTDLGPLRRKRCVSGTPSMRGVIGSSGTVGARSAFPAGQPARQRPQPHRAARPGQERRPRCQ
jgi:hypothetical protein